MVPYRRRQDGGISGSYRIYHLSQAAVKSVKRRDCRYDAIYAQIVDLTTIYEGGYFDLRV